MWSPESHGDHGNAPSPDDNSGLGAILMPKETPENIEGFKIRNLGCPLAAESLTRLSLSTATSPERQSIPATVNPRFTIRSIFFGIFYQNFTVRWLQTLHPIRHNYHRTFGEEHMKRHRSMRRHLSQRTRRSLGKTHQLRWNS